MTRVTDYRNCRYAKRLTVCVNRNQIIKIYMYVRRMGGEILKIEEVVKPYVYDIIFNWRDREKLIEFLEQENVEPFIENGIVTYLFPH